MLGGQWIYEHQLQPPSFPQCKINSHPQKALNEASGKQLTYYGQKRVKFVDKEVGDIVSIDFDVLDVQRVILSVTEMNRKNNRVISDGNNSYVENKKRIAMNRSGRLALWWLTGLFFLPLQVAALSSRLGGCHFIASGESAVSIPASTSLQQSAIDIDNLVMNIHSPFGRHTMPNIVTVCGIDEPNQNETNKSENAGHTEQDQMLVQEHEASAKERPTMPSKKEKECHELTHSEFKAWCPHCVLGGSRDDGIKDIRME